MIVKPCPNCEDEKSKCGCFPYFNTTCVNCNSVVHGRIPRDSCHKCSDSTPMESIE